MRPTAPRWERICRLIFLLAGVSYYKAFAPRRLVCRAFALDGDTAAFVETVYREGLGEFAYRNNIDLSDRINFAASGHAAAAQSLNLDETICIPVGGGKDSTVSIEVLRQTGRRLALFGLGSSAGLAGPIQDCIAAADLPAIRVGRTLSPALAGLNAQGAYNGHVPITAILSAIAVAACLLQGWGTLAMSNEHSASAPNLRHDGVEVNHQYSKSLAFEAAFAAYVTSHVASNFSYFSLLRPLSEAAITRRFAGLTAYHPVFRSCNTAFRQDERTRGTNWCCDCPKCRFVFLALAPFIARERLVAIFGRDMLDDTSQTEGFAGLCGLDAHKPFECVGEIDESRLLLGQLSRMAAWRDSAIVRHLNARMPDQEDFAAGYAALFDLKAPHRVPAPFLDLLR